jgi:hypothetical protein
MPDESYISHGWLRIDWPESSPGLIYLKVPNGKYVKAVSTQLCAGTKAKGRG